MVYRCRLGGASCHDACFQVRLVDHGALMSRPIVIPIEVVVTAALPSALTPTDATAPDAL